MFFVRQISFICVFKFSHERIRGGEKITVDSVSGREAENMGKQFLPLKQVSKDRS